MFRIPSKEALLVFVAILGIQCLAFLFIDPLGYPDTIRYFCLADMMTGGTRVSGDLAFFHGVLYTPLLLPLFLASFKKLFHLPFEISGIILQTVSFQVVIWLSYVIAMREGGKLAARLTLALLLTQLVFCFRSVLILTDYPFAALLLGALYYVSRKEKIGLFQAGVLSLFFAGLVALRMQGMIYIILIGVYLIFSRRIRLRLAAVLAFFPFCYLLCHFYYFNYLDHRFPGTLMLNGEFSWKTFHFGGDGALQYSFSTHGLEPAKNAATYSWKRFTESAASLYGLGAEYYLLFAGALLPAMVYSVYKSCKLMVLIILGNFIFVLSILAPYYSFIRYQTAIFPLCIILIAGYIAQNFNRRTPALLALSLFLYSAYFLADLSSYFGTASQGRYRQGMYCRQAIREAAESVRKIVPIESKILAADTWLYPVVVRSGHRPLYMSPAWSREALEDYTGVHQAYYIIGNAYSLAALADNGVRVVFSEEIFSRRQEKIYLARIIR